MCSATAFATLLIQGPNGQREMLRFVIGRTVSAIGVLFAISVLTFLVFEVLPDGDPAVRIAGREATAQEIALVSRQWGFNRPIYVQYVVMMHKILNGSVVSYVGGVNVETQIRAGLPVTLSVCVGAGIIWLVFGVLFGTVSGARVGRASDRLLTVLALIGVSTPSFLLGALLIYYLGYKFGLFPIGGYVYFSANPLSWFDHLLLPWFALAAGLVGIYSRVMRSSILDINSEDFVRTARGKGLSERQVMLRHVVRNAVVPIVALWGLDFAGVLGGGDILVEYVFNLPGIGQFAAQSIAQLDVPAVLVIVMFAAAAVVIMSAVVDVVYAVVDPRVRVTAA